MGTDAKKKTAWFLTAGAAAVLLAAVLSVLYGSTGIPFGHTRIENTQDSGLHFGGSSIFRCGSHDAGGDWKSSG